MPAKVGMRFLAAGFLMIALVFFTAHAHAQDASLSPQNFKKFKPVYDPQAAKKVASNLLPILPGETFPDSAGDQIPLETVNKISDKCLSKVPPRFTPDAHQYYCACTAAATQATMKQSELRDLQKFENWQVGNKTFEKYVHEVVSPCLDMPVDDMEYMSCILNRSNDWRIDNIPMYCKCISRAMREHVAKIGESEMMIEWGDRGKSYDSPLSALWFSDSYNQHKRQSGRQCVGSYMKKDPLGRY